MKELRYDIGHECHYVDNGYFRIEYILEDDNGYHIEAFIDGEQVEAIYAAHGVWTLDEAVEASRELAKKYLMDACGLVNELSCLDMEWVKRASEVVRDVEEEDE